MIPKAVNPASVSDTTSRPRLSGDVVPIAAAFVAISFAFGVLAKESQLSLPLALLMSAFVYAGTSQVVALGLLATSQPPWMIVLVTFLINARYLLIGSVLVEYLRRWTASQRVLFALALTDETFAIFLPRPGKDFPSAKTALWTQAAAYFAWLGGTALGYVVQADTSVLRGLGLDYALVAMLLAVLVLQLVDWKTVVVSAVAALVALVAVQAGWGWMATLIAVALAPVVGVFLERKCLPHK